MHHFCTRSRVFGAFMVSWRIAFYQYSRPLQRTCPMTRKASRCWSRISISLRRYWQQFARVSGSAAGPGGQGPGRRAIHRGRFWSLPVCAAAFGDKGSRRRRLASRAAGCPALGEIVYLPYPLANFLFQCYGFIKHFLWSALFQERFTEKTCRTPQPPGMLGFRHIPVSS